MSTSVRGPSGVLRRHLGLDAVAKSCLAQAFGSGYPTPALYGGVVRHDGFYGEYACGKRNVTSSASSSKYGSASCGDRVHIGSMTKQMTARMVRNALRGPAPTQGLASTAPGLPRTIGWSTKLGEVLPLPANSVMGAATLESFFDHTSGLLDHKMFYGLDFSTFSGWCKAARLLPLGTYLGAQDCWAPYLALDQPGSPLDTSLPPKLRLERKVEWLNNLCCEVDRHHSPEVSAQRGKYYYSNFGIALGSLMIEASFGIPYEQLLKEQVFDPCGMSTAGFGEPATLWRQSAAAGSETVSEKGKENGNSEQVGDAAAAFGHTYNGAWFLPKRMTFTAVDRDCVIPTLIRPAGDVHCSIRDHLAFLYSEMVEVRNCTDWKSDRFLSPTGPISASQPNSHYRRGWIVLHNKKDVDPNSATNGAAINTMQAQTSSDPETMLDSWDPFQTQFCLLHDGSSGIWYGLCGVFPELGLSAVAVTNSATLWTPGAVGKVVKHLIREAARLPPEVDGEPETDLDDGDERPRSAV